VARLLSKRDDEVRVTYRDERRLRRLGDLELTPVSADVLDRGALRRAFRGCELVFHTAGYVGARPVERVWEVNALAPRIAVEAAAAEGVRRVVMTSSVAGLGPVPGTDVGDEEMTYRGGGLGLTYADAKHEGEAEALAAGAREGIEVVIVNPTYVLGVPIDPSQPGETSNRAIGNYLTGRLPAFMDGRIDVADVRDVARGHLRAAERGSPGERYVLGGHELSWLELFERVAELSGVRHPLMVLPREIAAVARLADDLRLPNLVNAEGYTLMAQNWCYSSRKARGELGYRPRKLDATLSDTIDWYMELIDSGAVRRRAPSPLSLTAAGLRLADRAGLLAGMRIAERYTGRRLLVGR